MTVKITAEFARELTNQLDRLVRARHARPGHCDYLNKHNIANIAANLKTTILSMAGDLLENVTQENLMVKHVMEACGLDEPEARKLLCTAQERLDQACDDTEDEYTDQALLDFAIAIHKEDLY